MARLDLKRLDLTKRFKPCAVHYTVSHSRAVLRQELLFFCCFAGPSLFPVWFRLIREASRRARLLETTRKPNLSVPSSRHLVARASCLSVFAPGFLNSKRS